MPSLLLSLPKILQLLGMNWNGPTARSQAVSPAHRPSSVSGMRAAPTTAAACPVDDGVIFDVATGVVVNDDVVTHNHQINLELHDGVWKVSRIVRVQQWEGVAGCALSPADYPF